MITSITFSLSGRFNKVKFLKNFVVVRNQISPRLYPLKPYTQRPTKFRDERTQRSSRLQKGGDKKEQKVKSETFDQNRKKSKGEAKA